MSRNGVDVGCHVELMPDAADNPLKRADRWKLDGDHEAVSARHVRDRDDAMQSRVHETAPIHAVFYDFHAVYGARA